MSEEKKPRKPISEAAKLARQANIAKARETRSKKKQARDAENAEIKKIARERISQRAAEQDESKEQGDESAESDESDESDEEQEHFSSDSDSEAEYVLQKVQRKPIAKQMAKEKSRGNFSATKSKIMEEVASLRAQLAALTAQPGEKNFVGIFPRPQQSQRQALLNL